MDFGYFLLGFDMGLRAKTHVFLVEFCLVKMAGKPASFLRAFQWVRGVLAQDKKYNGSMAFYQEI